MTLAYFSQKSPIFLAYVKNFVYLCTQIAQKGGSITLTPNVVLIKEE